MDVSIKESIVHVQKILETITKSLSSKPQEKKNLVEAYALYPRESGSLAQEIAQLHCLLEKAHSVELQPSKDELDEIYLFTVKDILDEILLKFRQLPNVGVQNDAPSGQLPNVGVQNETPSGLLGQNEFLQRDLQFAQTEIMFLKTQIDELQKENETLKRNLQRVQRENETPQRDKREHEETLQRDLRIDLQTVQREKANLQREITFLTQDVELQRAQREQSLEDHEALQREQTLKDHEALQREQALQRENEDLQRELEALQRELALQSEHSIQKKEKLKENIETEKSNSNQQNEEDYDFRFKINSLDQLCGESKGWEIVAPCATDEQMSIFQQEQEFKDCKVVAVVGQFSKGKTFLVNQLFQRQFASGLLKHTEGLNFKWMKEKEFKNIVILDTIGTCAPVNMTDKKGVLYKKATEMFIQDVVFNISHYILITINDLTWPDQEYIEALAYRLSNQRSSKRIFMIHNYKEASTMSDVKGLFREQVMNPYYDNKITNLTTKPKKETGVYSSYYISEIHGIQFRHFILGRADTPGGERNHITIKEIIAQIRALEVSTNLCLRKSLINSCKSTLPQYMKGCENLIWEDSSDGSCLATMVPVVEENQKITIKHKLAYSPSGMGFGLTPSTFSPAVDLVLTTKDGTLIYIDVPGIKNLNVELVSTMDNQSHLVIKGQRIKPESYVGSEDVKQERQFGDFERTIPISSALRLMDVQLDNVDIGDKDSRSFHCSIPTEMGIACIKLQHHMAIVEKSLPSLTSVSTSTRGQPSHPPVPTSPTSQPSHPPVPTSTTSQPSQPPAPTSPRSQPSQQPVPTTSGSQPLQTPAPTILRSQPSQPSSTSLRSQTSLPSSTSPRSQSSQQPVPKTPRSQSSHTPKAPNKFDDI